MDSKTRDKRQSSQQVHHVLRDVELLYAVAGLVPGSLGVGEYRKHDSPRYPVTPHDANRELNVAVLVGQKCSSLGRSLSVTADFL